MKNLVAVDLHEFNSFSSDPSEFYLISLPLDGKLLWDFQEEGGERWPIDPVPPVLCWQVQLFYPLGMLWSSSFEGCHGEVTSGVFVGWKVPQSPFLQQILIYPL